MNLVSKIAHHFIWGSVMVNITLWNSEFPKNIKLAYLISVILKTYALEKKTNRKTVSVLPPVSNFFKRLM